MIQKSPMILSRPVPSGTGLRLLRLFTWMVSIRVPSMLKQITSIPGIARRGHHVPAELGQLETNIVQADVPDNLRRPFHWGGLYNPSARGLLEAAACRSCLGNMWPGTGRCRRSAKLHHFTRFDQVEQLVGASGADPDLGFMARLMALCSLHHHLAFRVLVEAAHLCLADAAILHTICQEELCNPGRDVSINPTENSILTPQRPVPDVRLGYASTGQM